MPLRTRTVKTALASEITLPPPYSLVSLREVGDAFGHATAIAAQSGAGTLVYVGRFDLAEFAVVLEPEEPLRIARRALYSCMTALAEAVAAHGPPDMAINIAWPDALNVNMGLVGGGRLAWPKRADENEPPPWLVFGAMVRTVSLSDEPGLHPISTALEQEGFSDFHASQLVESFARHLMVTMDSLTEYGFAAVAKSYLSRLAPESGLRRDIDENGDLLVRRAGKPESERKSLAEALATPSWLDRKTGVPRL
jgi:biotin-(acetyl-CoA carboxylase) ligase